MDEQELKELMDKAKAEGLQVFTQEKFDERMARAAKSWQEQQLAPIQQELETLKASNQDLAGKLESYKRAGKTPEELLEHERQTWDTQRTALEQEREQERQRAKNYLETMRAKELEHQLRTLFDSEDLPTPANLRGAMTVARAELPTMAVAGDDPEHFKLTYTDPTSQLPKDPAEAFGAWWKEQTYLHGAGPGGPPPTSPKPGQGSKGGNGKPVDPRARMDDALAAELPGVISRVPGQ